MSEITKRQFLQIQKVLQKRMANVRLSPGWHTIHKEWNIGTLHGIRLDFTNDDRDRLRRIAQQVAGADPLSAIIEGDRVATVGVVNDEKWSNETVFGGLIQVTSLKPIETTDGLAITPKGTSLNLEPESIRWGQQRPIIVVENGAAFRYWHECIIPEDFECAIAIYRGHDTAIKTVQGFLEQLPTEVVQVGFFDFDPAGLQMAISMGVASIIVPDDPQELLDLNKNVPERFLAQISRYPNLESEMPANWLSTWHWMKEKGASLSQEAMISVGSKLRVLVK